MEELTVRLDIRIVPSRHFVLATEVSVGESVRGEVGGPHLGLSQGEEKQHWNKQ